MKLFILGTTGYIGGDALYAISNAHPEYEITALVRNSEKGAQVASQYPKIKLVYGDSESADVIREEVRKADVVLHFANSADDEPGTKTITTSLQTRPSQNPIYYIHTSGTGILTWGDISRRTFGQESHKIHNDWDGVAELTSLPDSSPHRNIDKLVLAAGSSDPEVVRTAIVCPPCIYGPGRGPGNKTSIQVPGLARIIIDEGHGVQIGEGRTWWNSVHVRDLSDVYVALVEAAAAGGGGTATWGPEGYYLVESGEFLWGEAGKWIAQAAKKHGLIENDEVVSYSAEEVEKLKSHGSILWGSSSRGKAVRARELLGWSPSRPSLKDTVEEAVVAVGKRSGALPGHAKIAAGDV